MAFKVPESGASRPENMFGVELGDEKFLLPKMQYLSAEHFAGASSLAESLSGRKPTAREIAEMNDLYQEIMEHHAPGLYAKLDTEQFVAVLVAWAQESSIGVGESLASAD